ncbi:MAG: MotA/TolQ/ExbB proton channel family protein [Phycisphaeraceae bacterium]
MDELVRQFELLIDRGGWVMYPLLALALISIMLSVERVWFFVRTNGPAAKQRLTEAGRGMRSGQREAVDSYRRQDSTVYSRALSHLLADRPSEAAAIAAVEGQRHRLERFMPLLSTIITAAPMLGILGTVLGLIASFDVFSDRSDSASQAAQDLGGVSRGIAEALTTTAVGLIIAVATLLPYNLFRAQIDRSLSRLEGLMAAGIEAADRLGHTPGLDAAKASDRVEAKPGGKSDDA